MVGGPGQVAQDYLESDDDGSEDWGIADSDKNWNIYIDSFLIKEGDFDFMPKKLSQTFSCLWVKTHEIGSDAFFVHIIEIGAHLAQNFEKLENNELRSKVDDASGHKSQFWVDL